jgi:thymidylate synthase
MTFYDTNKVWQEQVELSLVHFDNVVKPRGIEVRERIGRSYQVSMISYLDLKSRKVNVPFMFSEAAWILSGSNRLSEVAKYMRVYENFSDDGIFLRGAYGPKIVDQLGYIVDTLELDPDTRQAFLNIWRERPGSSKDVSCTTGMQFFIRDNTLEMVVNMRSQDIILGFTYDVFTFSMVGKAVQLLLKERGIQVGLGNLQVNVGSLHIYERHYKEAESWIADSEIDQSISNYVIKLEDSQSYENLIANLNEQAHQYYLYGKDNK